MGIEIVRGDITRERVDAIVNAANSTLLGGGGVDGAIHRAAGPELLAECRDVRATLYPDGLPVGYAVVTGAGRLPARWVIHTVGPNAHLGQVAPDLLAACFRSCLRAAGEVGAASIAFPAISAGVFGWEIDQVAAIAREVLIADDAGPRPELVRLVAHTTAAEQAFRRALADVTEDRRR
ncbi:MAG: O-acetyl-ADP-ribose deacetylase [Bifidobacteriaceae bacterium]|nr:O-acetyl-ADP-ribose deacetylase [Bifidobacteriaceae bacterium]